MLLQKKNNFATQKRFIMKYDIFISYSRKDTKTVDKICRALDAHGITYFIDRAGISGGLEFPEIIVDAIRNSNVFLFIGSKNSYNSRYVANEVTYAYNVKRHNTILPYLIDNTPLPASLQFIFGNVNYRKVNEHPIETVLIDDIKNILGVMTEPEVKAPKPSSLSFKGRPSFMYGAVGFQLLAYVAVLVLFVPLFFMGWIADRAFSLCWCANLILCLSVVLSMAGTVFLLLRKKYAFYGLCCLDVVLAASICTVSILVNAPHFAYKSVVYTLINSVGAALSANMFLGIVIMIGIVALHCFVMYRVLKFKNNGISEWSLMR